LKFIVLNKIKLNVLALGFSLATALAQTNSLQLPPIAAGPFKPEWNSLTNYQTAPEWFRDAKFGIWAHWGPQCEPEHGDWYARSMYEEGSGNYKSHLVEYGHPSTNGFKDVIHVWKAEHFDPDKLLKFYKDNGAKIFMALANHHDNFDNFNSKYQPWNSVAVGPHKDLIGGWAAAARKNGLRFGVSVHASHTWMWNRRNAGTRPGRWPACLTTSSSPRPTAKDSGGMASTRRISTRKTTSREDIIGNGMPPKAAACPTRPTWRNSSSARSSFGTIIIPTRFTSTTRCCRFTVSRMKLA
jgi:alpha-L-fucosidase